MKIKKKLPKIILYRILGNDLPPRHKVGQTYSNLNFILKHEPRFPNCQKKWIVNQIFDPRIENKIIKLLKQKKQSYLRIPLNRLSYKINISKKIRLVNFALPRELREGIIQKLIFLKKNFYLINLNKARNLALIDGRRLADWVLPFDSNCCFNKKGFEMLTNKLSKQEFSNKCFAVNMYRLKHNKEYFNFHTKKYSKQEPQLTFGKNSKISFDESQLYGYKPKVSLFERMKFKIKQTKYSFIVTDQKSMCGYVLRLSSGCKNDDKFMTDRGVLREKALLNLFKKADKLILENKLPSV